MAISLFAKQHAQSLTAFAGGCYFGLPARLKRRHVDILYRDHLAIRDDLLFRTEIV
jgi:hypothetical protein